MRNVLLLPIITMSLFGFGCANRSVSESPTKADNSAVVEEVESQYFYGPSDVYFVTGSGELTKVKTDQSLVRRIINRQNKKIFEQVVSISDETDAQHRPTGSTHAELYLVEFKISEDLLSFTMEATNHNAFSGKGKLFGTAWKWDAWESDSEMPEGQVHSEDKITVEGLIVEKKFFKNSDQGPKLQLIFKERLKTIDVEEYRHILQQHPVENDIEG